MAGKLSVYQVTEPSGRTYLLKLSEEDAKRRGAKKVTSAAAPAEAPKRTARTKKRTNKKTK